uniref:Uncharacterized protein n=2 Tax=Rhizophagus irregularis TaxID=588596 RepID=U9SYI8_RHIID
MSLAVFACLALGPASRLADFAKELGKRKLKPFSSYKTQKYLENILSKYKNHLNPQLEVEGGEASGHINFTIKKIIYTVNEELIAVTEGKQKDLVVGFMQNVMQLESSYHTNTRKRKAYEAFDHEFDYLYGIVTTASAERTYCTKADYHIALTKDILDDDIKLRQGVKEVMEVIVGLLKDWVEVDDSPDIKKARMEKYIKGIIDHNILV